MSKAIYDQLERVGRIRLSANFYLRDFLHSEIASAYGLANVPDDPELATEAGSRLCEELLEPIRARFGHIHIRSAFRSCEVNALGNANGLNCSRNEANYADHIWDRRDAAGRLGATACIVIPAFADRFHQPGDWTELAWWLKDNLPYSSLCFFPKRWAVNVQWREEPEGRISSYAGWSDNGQWKKSGILSRSRGNPDAERYARLTQGMTDE